MPETNPDVPTGEVVTPQEPAASGVDLSQLSEAAQNELKALGVTELNNESVEKLLSSLTNNRKTNQRLSQENANLSARLSQPAQEPQTEAEEGTPTEAPAPKPVSDFEMETVSFMLASRFPHLKDQLADGSFINEANVRGLFANGQIDLKGLISLAERENSRSAEIAQYKAKIAELEKAPEQPSYTPPVQSVSTPEAKMTEQLAENIIAAKFEKGIDDPRFQEAQDFLSNL